MHAEKIDKQNNKNRQAQTQPQIFRIMVRKATEEDIPRLMELLHQVNMVHYELRPDLFKPNTTKYDEGELRQLLSDELTPVFVYEQMTVLGYVFVRIEETRDDRLMQDRKTLYIDDLCVDITARGQHIGARLFDFVHRWAEQQGFQSITLNVWACNESAFKFYQKAGMKIRKTCMEMKLDKMPVEQKKPKTVLPKTKAEARVQKMVLVIGKQKLPRRQIMADLGLKQKSRQAFIDHYWRPAWEQGLIDLVHPNVPNKPEQTYCLTAKGKELYAQLTCKE